MENDLYKTEAYYRAILRIVLRQKEELEQQNKKLVEKINCALSAMENSSTISDFTDNLPYEKRIFANDVFHYTSENIRSKLLTKCTIQNADGKFEI